MSFAARILDAWPANGDHVTFTRSRRQRAVRAATSIARLAMAGPDEWRRTARRTLLGVGRMLVDLLDDAPSAAPQISEPMASEDVLAHEPLATTAPRHQSELPPDTDWAAWM